MFCEFLKVHTHTHTHTHTQVYILVRGFHGSSADKESPAIQETFLGLIPVLGSFPGER